MLYLYGNLAAVAFHFLKHLVDFIRRISKRAENLTWIKYFKFIV